MTPECVVWANDACWKVWMRLFSLAMNACIANRINVCEALRSGDAEVIQFRPPLLPGDDDDVIVVVPQTAGAGVEESKAFVAADEDDATLEEEWSVSCEACMETSRCYQLACGTRFCAGCLKKLFVAATRDVALMPPRCCRVPIDPNLSDVLLRGALLERFRRMHTETVATHKMYCPQPACAAFINLDLVEVADTSGELGCPTCATTLCVWCKSHAHPRRPCPTLDDPVMFLAEARDWKRCPGCRHLVELTAGCNHITCVCKFEFCYRCTSPWWQDKDTQRRLCHCELFDHEHLANAANDAVRAQEAAQGRQFNVAERRGVFEHAARGLAAHEDCAHDWIRTQPSPEYACRNCGFNTHFYSYQCSDCDYVACYTCRFHRLER